jgi:two-component system NtrC family sensor kinase
MALFQTLGFRVLAGMILLLAVLFGFFSYYTIAYHSEQMMAQVYQSANRISDIIEKSTHYSMMLDRRDDTYQTITTIGEEPGVVGIRILNKRGEITFSTDKPEIQTRVDMDAEQCYLCHQKGQPLHSLPSTGRTRIYPSEGKGRIMGLINPIRNEPSCYNAPCHVHPAEQTILGVLDIRMSLAEIDKALDTERKTMISYALLWGGVAAFGVAGFFFLIVIRPLGEFKKGMKRISAGNLAQTIVLHRKDEFGNLARSFNEMARALANEKEENTRWSQTLEQRVAEKTEELKQIHRHVLQIEKMASLGKLSATVAHELNNPLAGVLTYAKLIHRRMERAGVNEKDKQTFEELELIIHEIDRCGAIVKNLLMFSRKQVGDIGIVHLSDVIDRAHRLVQHHFELANVRFEFKPSCAESDVMGDEQQLQQALVALFVNAVEAMPHGGSLTVDLGITADKNEVTLSISDTGIGISKEDIPNIFEPFFTTKQEGKGVGLGLSIVYGIIKRHNGKINVQSDVGRGTTFTIILPKASSDSRIPQTAPSEIGETL